MFDPMHEVMYMFIKLEPYLKKLLLETDRSSSLQVLLM